MSELENEDPEEQPMNTTLVVIEAAEKIIPEGEQPPGSNTVQTEILPGGLQPSTTNMEVHHHPNLHHKKKYFREYFLEFLMIFLAVTMGFFAEQIREHYVETKREKESMISLVKDLESDTLQFNDLRRFRSLRLGNIDTVLVFFAGNDSPSIPVRIYNATQSLFGHQAFFQNSGTLDQLNKAGGLRLIQKRKVVDSIESYDQQVKRLSLRDIYETNFTFENRALSEKIFEGRSVLKNLADTIYFNRRPSGQSIKVIEQYRDEYINSLITFRRFVQKNMELQAVIKIKAVKLLVLIKKEYQLD